MSKITQKCHLGVRKGLKRKKKKVKPNSVKLTPLVKDFVQSSAVFVKVVQKAFKVARRGPKHGRDSSPESFSKRFHISVLSGGVRSQANTPGSAGERQPAAQHRNVAEKCYHSQVFQLNHSKKRFYGLEHRHADPG